MYQQLWPEESSQVKEGAYRPLQVTGCKVAVVLSAVFSHYGRHRIENVLGCECHC